MANESIGGAFFELAVGSAKFDAALEKAAKDAAAASSTIQVELDKTSAAHETVGAKAEESAGGMKSATEAVKEATGPFKEAGKAVHAISSAVGLVTLAATPFIIAFRTISEEMRVAKAAAAGLNKELNDLSATRLASSSGGSGDLQLQKDLQDNWERWQKRRAEFGKAHVNDAQLLAKINEQKDADDAAAQERNELRIRASTERQRQIRQAQVLEEVGAASDIADGIEKSLLSPADAINKTYEERIELAKKAGESPEGQLTADRLRKAAMDERAAAFKKMFDDENKSVDDYYSSMKEAQDKIEKDAMASRKRINEADLKQQLDNLRRLEDARRAQQVGFGVGDAAAGSLADVVNVLRSIESNTGMISR